MTKPPRSPVSTKSLGFGILPQEKGAQKTLMDSSEDRTATRKGRILIVDHDLALRRILVTRLGAANYAVETAEDAKTALDACTRSRPHLLITDLQVTDMDGLAFLREIKGRWPQLAVIVLTAHGTIAEAVEATQIGAFGYLVKPVGKDELLGQVERAIEASTVSTEGDWRANIVSRSQLMEDRLEIANRAAACDVPVLLIGESGTGKELLARAIHSASGHRDRPFIVISCSQSAEVLEAELFNEGWLRRGQGGTVMLEEVGNLPWDLQSRLSATLAKENAETRLISTTSRDLRALTETGSFLQALYYQISILPIEMPPLGRRREDIPLLVSHFLEQATESGGEAKIYSPQAIELLATTDWPGNVRQLFDLVKKSVGLTHGKVITKDIVEQSLDDTAAKIPTFDEARDKFVRDYLAENLQMTAGNVSQAARLAKRSRTDFYKLLARYRLRPNDFKNAGTAGDPEKKPGDQSEEKS